MVVGTSSKEKIFSSSLGRSPSMKYSIKEVLSLIPVFPASILNWDTYSLADPVCFRFRISALAFPGTSVGANAPLIAATKSPHFPKSPKVPSWLLFSKMKASFHTLAVPSVMKDRAKEILLISVSKILLLRAR